MIKTYNTEDASGIRQCIKCTKLESCARIKNLGASRSFSGITHAPNDCNEFEVDVEYD